MPKQTNSSSPSPSNSTLSPSELAKSIDHPLLQPSQSDREFDQGCELAKQWQVAAACVKSADVARARARLEGSGVATCAVVGFPHANSPTDLVCLEAERALAEGATEIDAVITLARVVSEDWAAVAGQIEAYNRTVIDRGGILKLIFETGLISNREHKIRLCQLCREYGVAYVKTSTGFALATRPDGTSITLGATLDDVSLMREHAGPVCKVKASGGIRSYSDALSFLTAGATRLGTASTERILRQATEVAAAS
ncbi:MAG: deoxyribose-phosphate aldolase [Myxococcales bacterium]